MKQLFWKKVLGTSIKTQLLIPLILLITLSFIIVSFLGIRAITSSGRKSQTITAAATQERIKQFLTQTATAVAANNSAIFKNIQLQSNTATSYATKVLSSPAVYGTRGWNYDQQLTPAPGGGSMNGTSDTSSIYIPPSVALTPAIKQQVARSGYFDDAFPATLANEKNAVAIYYIGNQGETRYYPNIGLGTIVPPAYTPVEDVFFKPITPQNDPQKTVQWSEVYDDPAGNGLLVTASNPLYINNTFAGMIGIDVTLNNVAKNVENYTPIESSYAFLINNDGRAIALPGQAYEDMLGRKSKKGEFGTDLSKVKGGFAGVLHSMRSGKQGFDVINANGKTLDISYAPVTGTTFSLAIVAKQSVLLQVVGDLRKQVAQTSRDVLYTQMLPAGIILLALVWAASFIYIRFMTKPIIELTERTHRVTEGDLKQRITTDAQNEIGTLASAFNTMTSQLGESYENLERKVQERTKSLNQRLNEIREAKAKDEAILSSMGEGVLVTDNRGAILLINEVAAELRNIPYEHALGTNVNDYPIYDDQGKPLPATQQPIHRALEMRRKINQDVYVINGNTKKSISVTATPVLEQNRLIGAIQIIRDVTREKEVDRMKTEFISLASHQLRTPLSAIRWFCEMLISGEGGKLKKPQVEFAQNIYESSERMTQLVDSLLNISRIESGRISIRPEPTDVGKLVDGIVQDLQAKIAERNQHVSVSVTKGLREINLDPHMIGQVYLNLLTNAIKYTPKKGKITVTVTTKGTELISEVSDNGYGIPKAEQPKLFRKFFRATNITKIESDGTGLGMYLVKAVVESSGGKIWFKSDTNKGTTFWFSLPLTGMKPKEGEVTLIDAHGK